MTINIIHIHGVDDAYLLYDITWSVFEM